MNSDAKLPITVKVIDATEVNSIGLPGGFIYVTTGLIQTADNEAQLAAMMSHAIAHVAARHAAEQLGKATFVNMLALPSTAFPITANPLPNSLTLPSFYAFSRKDEEEADFLGLQYLYKAGYDPNAMTTFFQKIAARGGAPVSKSYVSHPQTEERMAKSAQNIRTYMPARAQNVVTTPEFEAIKNRMSGDSRRAYCIRSSCLPREWVDCRFRQPRTLRRCLMHQESC